MRDALASAESRTRLLKHAIRFLMKLGKPRRALVLTRAGGELKVEAVFGFETEEVPDAPVAQVARRIMRDGKPVMLADTAQDNTYKVNDSEIVSLLSVPFRSARGYVQGLLYVDSSEKVAFDYQHLNQAKEFVEGFESRWNELSAQPETSPSQAGTPAKKVGSGASRLLAPLVIALFLGVGAWATKQAISVPEVLQTPTAEAPDSYKLGDPKVVARFFLTLSYRRQLQPAYSLLSRSLQGRYTAPEFVNLMQTWLKEEASRKNRVEGVEIIQQDGQSCLVKVQLVEPGGEATTWSWKLVNQGADGWKLDQIDGGPPL